MNILKYVTPDVTITRQQLCPRKQYDPTRAYKTQKNGAKSRGIAWEFTFESWWEIWEPYFHLRGSGKNGLCMARFGDEGPYSPTNVYLTTNMGNSIDKNKTRKAILRKQATKERHEAEFFRHHAFNRALDAARKQDNVNEARETGLI